MVSPRAAMEDAVDPRADELGSLFRLAEHANLAERPSDVYQPAIDAITELLRVDRAAVLLFDDAGVMRFVAWRGLSQRYRAAVEGHTPWRRDSHDARPILVADVHQAEDLAGYRAVFDAERIRALGFVPLVHGDEVIGKFMIYDRVPRSLTEHEVALAQVVAAHVAQAVARGRLLERERQARARAERQADRTRRLERVTGRLSRALEPAEISHLVLSEGSEALAAYSAGIWMLSEERDALELVGAVNYPEESRQRVQRIPLTAEAPVVDAAVRGAPVWLESFEEYAARYPVSAARSRDQAPAGGVAIACLPLALDGVVRGAAAFSFVDARRFDEEERAFVGLLVQACAHAFERARLYGAERAARQEAESERARAAFLAEASAILAGSLDYQATLQSVARLAVPRIADWCAVDLAAEDAEQVRLAVHHVDPEKVALAERLRRRWPPDMDAPRGVGHVIRTGASELYEEIPDAMIDAIDDPERRAMTRELGLRSALCVPMRAHGETVGAITLVSAESGRRLGAADLAMAEQLGERAGLAIANARLYEQARRAVSVRDDFLSIAGHELKTPLTALLMQAQAVARLGEQVPARIGERLDKIERVADRMRILIDELLDVSRITAGRLNLQLEEVDLAAMVVENVGRLSESLTRAGSEVQLDVDGALRGRWDRSRVEQVVTNLLSNAIKYGKGKPIEVRAEARADRAVLTVRDHGIGIEPEDQARIFDRFERAVSSRHFGGLGLGLWIVRQIIEAHGGTISVDSTPGQGARFQVALPLVTAQKGTT